jgi:hydrogenase maturation protein HypF
VLLRRRAGNGIAAGVAPEGNPCLGVMLAYTPLHHLLLNETGLPLVAPSGNVSEEPMVIDERDAPARLGHIADLLLVHDRPILRPLDDTVARLVCGRPQILRRGRGYAPAAVAGGNTSGVLALGGHLKAAVALSRADGLVLSEPAGDLDGPRSRDAYAALVRDLPRLFRYQPRALACDLHPDYHSSRAAEAQAAAAGLELIRVQHHLAHVAAGMAEHDLEAPLLGVAWDGTGYGLDGTVWGGEFLWIGESGWRRVAHFRTFPLPGGEAAVREPRRAAFGLLYEMLGDVILERDDLAPLAAFYPNERRTLARMIARGANAPLTSSAGRLFDAAAAVLDLCQSGAYEGQAACRLEWAALDSDTAAAYEFNVAPGANGEADWVIDWSPALQTIINDRHNGVPVADIARAFHNGLARAIATVADKLKAHQILLTGGCFQNGLLTEAAAAELQDNGHAVYWQERVPPNDGGLALGQAFWAARERQGGER